MNKNELIENLLAFDEEASLLSVSQNIKYQCYIVGGGALLLLDLIPRATYDIDVIRCTGEHLVSIMADYDINMLDYDKNEFIYFYKEYRKEFFH